MSETTRRLTYSVPLALVGLLLLLENVFPRPYVFASGSGLLSYAYYKALKPESYRYSNALIKISHAYGEIGGNRLSEAVRDLSEASALLAEVNTGWAFQALPEGLGETTFHSLKKDLPVLVSELSKGAPSPALPENARTKAYLAEARSKLPNGGIL